jgi:hypothetical protein
MPVASDAPECIWCSAPLDFSAAVPNKATEGPRLLTKVALFTLPIWGTALYAMLSAIEWKFLGYGLIGATYNLLFWLVPFVGVTSIAFSDRLPTLAKIASALLYIPISFGLSLLTFIVVGHALGIPGP